MDNQKCPTCFDSISIDTYESHINNCITQQQEYFHKLTRENPQKSTIIHNISTNLSIIQNKALNFSYKKSRIYSKNTKLEAQHRFKIKGFTEDIYNKTINYIKNNVKIIIHINLEKTLKKIIEDDYYRNSFETGNSGGSNDKVARSSWENQLFNSLYANSSHEEKVKYGALNLTNSPKGIDSCYGYGNSFLVLKNEIKDRCTFVLGDSSKMDMHLGTFKYCDILLALMPNNLLDKVINISIEKIDFCDYGNFEYIEAQIHGPIRLHQDIELLVVNSNYNTNGSILDLLDQFSNKYNCPYIFMSP